MGNKIVRNQAISGKTTVCGVIGDPIEHTMSPVMHNAAFREMELDYVYLPFRVGRENLGRAIDGMRGLNIRGLNVTIPHKVDVIPFLDKLDTLAGQIGAVNTIVNDSGTLTGFNTDSTGFLQAMLEKGIEPAGKNVAVIGAGGAARGICFILSRRGAGITILNRAEEFEWAVGLAKKITDFSGKEVHALRLDDDNLAAALAKSDILVNATSVGMSPESGNTPVPSRLLRPSLVVFDIVYNPIKTRLTREAEEAGAHTISGLDMLAWQGAQAFEMWTGKKPPVEIMKREAVKALQSK